MKFKLLTALIFIQLILISPAANSNVVLTECNICFSDDTYEFTARSFYESSDLTVIILNTQDMNSRKYDVTGTGSTRDLDGGVRAFREPFQKGDSSMLNTFMRILQEIANKDAIDVPDMVASSGFIIDSMWDLIWFSSNREHFEQWMRDHITLLGEFTVWLNNVSSRFNVTSYAVTIKFEFEFSDGSTVLVEIKNELIEWIEYKDKDDNVIPLSNPRHGFGATHRDYTSWDLWMSWVHTLGYIRYYDDGTDPNACSLYITTCQNEWQDDEVGSRSSGPSLINKTKDIKHEGVVGNKWVQVCTLACGY